MTNCLQRGLKFTPIAIVFRQEFCFPNSAESQEGTLGNEDHTHRFGGGLDNIDAV